MLRILSKQKSGLKVVHLNAQSLNNKLDEFRNLFISSGVDIVCISETWFHSSISDTVYQLPGFSLFRADRVTNAGGVCIYIRKDIKCKIILKSEPNSPIEYLFLEVAMNYVDKLLVGCVYRPNRNIPLEALILNIQDVTLPYKDIIIAGDFNSNLIVDNTLREYMLAIDLHPTNNTIPTHYTPTLNSLLDIFFVNHKSRVLLYDQLSASMFSKHDLIFMIYDVNLSMSDTKITYRDFRHANYDILPELAAGILWESIYDLVNVDDQVAFMENNVNALFDMCVPIKSRLIKHKQQPWFNDNIKQLIITRNFRYRRWKRFKTSVLYLSFKEARRDVVRCIHLAKSSYYERQFASAINNASKWKQIRGIGIGKINKTNISTDLDINSLNMQFVGENSVESIYNVYTDYSTAEIENKFSFHCVTTADVVTSLYSIKSNAVGIDGICPMFIKILIPIILPYVTYIFNNVLTKSIFPTAWKCSKILPIPKSNNEYRPIAILPYISKALEKIIYRQMDDYISENNLLANCQSGFRPKRSCITTLIKVTDDLRESLEDNMISFLILLDHSKAFDTVVHSILLTKLDKLFSFSNTACSLIASYIENRTQTVFLGKRKSVPLANRRGVPQGSILGPLLFSLYINDLPEVLRYCKIQMYADDVQLYLSSNVTDLNSCIESINVDLNNISIWASKNGLCLNPNKSKSMLFSRRKTALSFENPIELNNSRIEFVQTAVNLGITFNSQLSWTNHINTTVGKVYGMLRNLWAVQTSTPYHIRMLLAKTYLIPVLLYGCELYQNCDSTDYQRLKVTYNNIARYIFNRKRNERISSYSYQIFNMPFDNVLKYKSILFLHKLVYTQEPNYLYEKIKFGRSQRGKIIITITFKFLISERQFFISATRLWNNLPSHIQCISNAVKFKKELLNHLK